MKYTLAQVLFGDNLREKDPVLHRFLVGVMSSRMALGLDGSHLSRSSYHGGDYNRRDYVLDVSLDAQDFRSARKTERSRR